MAVKLLSGTQHKVDHTPGSALTAGDVVELGSYAFTVSVDIAAGELGSINAPSGTATYVAPKATGVGTALSVGDVVYWDGTNAGTTNTDPVLGIVVAAAADGDATVNVLHSVA